MSPMALSTKALGKLVAVRRSRSKYSARVSRMEFLNFRSCLRIN